MSRYEWPSRARGEAKTMPGRARRFMRAAPHRLRPGRRARRVARRARPARDGRLARAPGQRRARTCGCRSARRRWSAARRPASRASPAASTRSRCTRTASALYAASANGGVWYSGDGGAHWRSLGGPGRDRHRRHRPPGAPQRLRRDRRVVARRDRPTRCGSAPARSAGSPDAPARPLARRHRHPASRAARPRRPRPTRGSARRRTCIGTRRRTRSRSSRAAAAWSRRRRSACSSAPPTAASNVPTGCASPAAPFNDPHGALQRRAVDAGRRRHAPGAAVGVGGRGRQRRALWCATRRRASRHFKQVASTRPARRPTAAPRRARRRRRRRPGVGRAQRSAATCRRGCSAWPTAGAPTAATVVAGHAGHAQAPGRFYDIAIAVDPADAEPRRARRQPSSTSPPPRTSSIQSEAAAIFAATWPRAPAC